MSGDFEYQWSELVARAWDDPAFKARLLADPAGVLKEQGLAVPPGITLKVVENTDKVLHLTLPVKPSAEELSVEELDSMAGGLGYGGCRGCHGPRGCGYGACRGWGGRRCGYGSCRGCRGCEPCRRG
jgi:hypothetical protein